MIKAIQKLVCLIACLYCCNLITAQIVKTPKFGDVSIEDFSPVSNVIDSSTEAVILFDIGSVEFEKYYGIPITMVYRFHRKVLLKKRTSFENLTKVLYPVLSGSGSDIISFSDVHAYTYNIENGKIISTKVRRGDMLKEKVSELVTLKTIAFPDVREGSIIEYSYKMETQLLNDVPDWKFEGKYPILRSEYQVDAPCFLDYLVNKNIPSGFLDTDSTMKVKKKYNGFSRDLPEDCMDTWYYWVAKNKPAFKDEPFITTMDNYVAKVSFDLTSSKAFFDIKVNNKGWKATAAALLNSSAFLSDLNIMKVDSVSKYVQKEIVDSGAKDIGTAIKIYNYVRNNFVCSERPSYRLSQSIVKTIDNKKGNVADINLLLLSLLAKQGFKISPVILSTREHGRVGDTTSLLNQYNYVICVLIIDSTSYFLDASNAKLGFGKLPKSCYNGNATVIQKNPIIINLSADALQETKSTVLFIFNDTKNKMQGNYTTTLGYYESLLLREKFSENKTEEFFNRVAKEYPFNIEFKQKSIDSLKNLEAQVIVKYEFTFDIVNDEFLYFNPSLVDGIKENPFKSADRICPVEMPYTTNDIFNLKMEIPKGYKIEELPKSTRVKLNNADGIFEYLINSTDEYIQLRYTLKLNKANFSADDYDSLRNFYSLVVKKQAEQIVFKKIK